MTIATGSLIVAWLILVGAVYWLTFRVQRLMDLAESIVNERRTVPEPQPEKFLGIPMVTDTVETARIVEADLDRLLDHPSRGRHSAPRGLGKGSSWPVEPPTGPIRYPYTPHDSERTTGR